MNRDSLLLVGDNPFHQVSHLSQERATSRGEDLLRPECAANLVMTSVCSGANGFMFTASETTLQMLRIISKRKECEQLPLYAITPYAYDFVRIAAITGGMLGLAKKLAKEIVYSWNYKAIINGVKGVLRVDPTALLKCYLIYEIYRLKKAADNKLKMASVLLHEIVTDMALALNMDWIFKTHMDVMQDNGLKAGFETRNFFHFVKKFGEWGIKTDNLVIAAPFNKLGFQMNPSKEKCEEALAQISEAEVIAFSVLAAGHLNLANAMDYIAALPNVSGVAIGVSREQQAIETFNECKLYLQQLT